jgi:hypothetical protein
MTKTPTIGRVINYVPTKKEKEKWNADIIPAMIVKVWASDMVNLRVFPDSPPSNEEHIASVELSPLKAERSWHWPEIKKE